LHRKKQVGLERGKVEKYCPLLIPEPIDCIIGDPDNFRGSVGSGIRCVECPYCSADIVRRPVIWELTSATGLILFFKRFPPPGWVPPTSTNHRLQAQRVGPAHKLFSAAEYCIGNSRICQEKNFIYFELLALHLMP